MSTPNKPPPPALYLLLFLPFGASSGFIIVTIGSLASEAGLSDGTIAGLIAINTLPHTWKFLWAPLVDTTWTGRGWYISTNLIASGSLIALGFIPIREDNVSLMTTLIFINGVATTFVGMCTESLMARLTPPEQRGAAGGWSQAGNLGGSTLGGLGLLIAEEVEYPWIPGVVIGGLLLSCSLILAFVREPPPPDPRPSFIANLKTLGKDVWALLVDPKRSGKVRPRWLLGFPPVFFYVLSGAGILSIGLCLVPIGSGGAQNLFAAMAPDWGASQRMVSITNGLVSGGASIAGCIVGGLISDLIDKRWAYALSGVSLALVAFAMATLPQQPVFYAGGVVLYSFALGLCYATFSAFVLDIIGHTGGATKYNLFASLANMPILAMTWIDGAVADDYGRIPMLWVDGLAGLGGATVLMLLVWVLRRRHIDPAPAQ
jgi:MFS transporter, PAT family, beta-lactamase induction signal transducer AmpG